MAYQVVKAAGDCCTVELISCTGNARFFKTAQWHFRVEQGGGGALLTCVAEFTLRLRYILLGPILHAKRSAIGCYRNCLGRTHRHRKLTELETRIEHRLL